MNHLLDLKSNSINFEGNTCILYVLGEVCLLLHSWHQSNQNRNCRLPPSTQGSPTKTKLGELYFIRIYTYIFLDSMFINLIVLSSSTFYFSFGRLHYNFDSFYNIPKPWYYYGHYSRLVHLIKPPKKALDIFQ